MAFRCVTLASEADVHVRAGQLIICGEDEISIPTEDIAALILEHWRVHLSSAALASLSETGVAVIFCDRRHMPVGVLTGTHSHSRQSAVARAQISMSRPLTKRLWQRLMEAKIHNQAACLDALALPGADRLREYANRVVSGDTTGMEAAAARLYFARLMPGEQRHAGGRLDGALDYGYAIVRALVSRLLVGHGLYAALGIHHANESNAFNLADDVLEPFRPLVDLRACSSEADVSDKVGRMTMTGILGESCCVGGNQYSVLTAAEVVVASFLGAVVERSHERLLTPVLVPRTADELELSD